MSYLKDYAENFINEVRTQSPKVPLTEFKYLEDKVDFVINNRIKVTVRATDKTSILIIIKGGNRFYNISDFFMPRFIPWNQIIYQITTL